MRRIPLFLALLAALLVQPLGAQDITYRSTTKMEMGGDLGAMMSMMGGLGDPTVETTYLKGTLIRTDSDDTSTIFDWGEGVMTQLDHGSRTFMRFTLADMTAAMSDAMAGMDPNARPTAEAEETPEVQFEVRFSSDRTGESMSVGGYEAEQVILTMEIVPKEGAEPMEDQQPGNMAVVTELWMSTDFPEYRRMQEMSGEMAESFRGMRDNVDFSQVLAGMQGADPRMQEAWEKNAEALSELEGTALRTVVNFVMVPPGADLDADQVLAMADEDISSGGAGALASAGAAAAAKSALSGLAGRFGRGKKEEPEEVTMSQTIFMRTVTEIMDVSEGTLDPSLFEVPEGYTERTLDLSGRR